MNSRMVLYLDASPEQSARLERLQVLFSEVCNALGPLVRDTRCWNRVGLHHLAYRRLRQQFPGIGSQMVCNAIYSVSRAARSVFQNNASPWSIDKRPGMSLPLLRFAPSAPVYFDRHTLSLQNGVLSLFTLDGRMRFKVGLNNVDEVRFREEKLKEILLSKDTKGFHLVFSFADLRSDEVDQELPEYVFVLGETSGAVSQL